MQMSAWLAKAPRTGAPMKSVVVFGTTQAAELVNYYVNDAGEYRVVAFTVDGNYMTCKTFCGLPVVPFETVETIYPPTDCLMTVQLGTRRANQLRAEKYLTAKGKGYKFLTYIDTRADVWDGLDPGENTWVSRACTVAPFAQLGNNVCLTGGSYIGHHSIIGDHCFIGAQAVVLGNVEVGPFCFLGANCTVREHTKVGERCIIDAGVYVAGDVEGSQVILNRNRHGVPSRESRT
jgi:sugar O-acyltransferase (sialic acid O-acetyltransferase NeuD family)